jgi:hypothetical protein
LRDLTSSKESFIEELSIEGYQELYLRLDSISVDELCPGSLISADGKTIGVTALDFRGNKSFYFVDL